MFTKFTKEPTALDKEIARVLEQLKVTDATSEEYKQLLKHLTKLHKMKTDSKSSQVSKDTALMAATNLAGIMMIINYERIHAISTKALGFVKFR